MRIQPASANDLSSVRAAYAHGRELQRQSGSTLWPEFSDEAILAEIARGDLFRVVDSEELLAGVFSLASEDSAIWGELETGRHVYLHRIARAPEWKGSGLVEFVLTWAAERCRALGRAGIRIDTWASNSALIAFYESRGFTLIGHRRIGVEPRLPVHYHGNEFALLERS